MGPVRSRHPEVVFANARLAYLHPQRDAAYIQAIRMDHIPIAEVIKALTSLRKDRKRIKDKSLIN